MDRSINQNCRMGSKKRFVLSCIIFYLTVNLTSVAQEPITIQTGPGPEDIVLDESQDFPRLLVSTTARRAEMAEFGEIQECNLNTNVVRNLPRFKEPTDLEFFPHGISIINIDDKPFLYVISHYKTTSRHPVIRYQIHRDSLVFDKIYQSDLLISPNALTVFEDGSFLVCNDASGRDSKIEQILGLKTGNILLFAKEGDVSLVASKLGMPAGMNRIDNSIFVACATENRIYRFEYADSALKNKKLLTKIKGPDNIRVSREGLWVCCHKKTMAFVRHISNADYPSLSTAVLIDERSGEVTEIFEDSGEIISAASVALPYSGYAYIGQIFGTHLLKVKL